MKRSLSATIDWLMDGDPAIRWQTMRDLLDEKAAVYEKEREKTAKEGWGARLLSYQDADGLWAGGVYTPKWTSTTYTLLLLRDIGIPPNNSQARKGTKQIFDRAVPKEVKELYRIDTCIYGMWLALGCYFGIRDKKLEVLAEGVLRERMPDGAWNCRKRHGAVHSSFHTTFNILDGVREAIHHKVGPTQRLKRAEDAALEFMLEHRMFRSDKTGRVINPVFLRLPYPNRWHYDILRGMDYIRTTKYRRDRRLEDAFGELLDARTKEGLWKLSAPYGGKTFFAMETPGKPSRWNTLRALRSLKDANRL